MENKGKLTLVHSSLVHKYVKKEVKNQSKILINDKTSPFTPQVRSSLIAYEYIIKSPRGRKMFSFPFLSLPMRCVNTTWQQFIIGQQKQQGGGV